MYKRTWFLIFFIICLLSVSAAQAVFSGGSGTKEDPYLISSADDLYAFQQNVNAGTAYENVYFKLTQDITLNKGLDLSNIWIPVKHFAGVLNGDGHVISGIYVPALRTLYDLGLTEDFYSDEVGETIVPSKAYHDICWGSGLFSILDGTVRNLTVSGLLEAPFYNAECGTAGGITAENNGTIANCTSYMTFYANDYDGNNDFGGITAVYYGSNTGTVKNCTDESKLYIDPESSTYVSFNKGIHDEYYMERFINYTDHSQNMGYCVPTVWNVYKGTADCLISYNANGGENAPKSESVPSGSDYRISSKIPTRDGFTFGGWMVNKNPDQLYDANDTMKSVAGDITLFAKWAENNENLIQYYGTRVLNWGCTVKSAHKYNSASYKKKIPEYNVHMDEIYDHCGCSICIQRQQDRYSSHQYTAINCVWFARCRLGQYLGYDENTCPNGSDLHNLKKELKNRAKSAGYTVEKIFDSHGQLILIGDMAYREFRDILDVRDGDMLFFSLYHEDVKKTHTFLVDYIIGETCYYTDNTEATEAIIESLAKGTEVYSSYLATRIKTFEDLYDKLNAYPIYYILRFRPVGSD